IEGTTAGALHLWFPSVKYIPGDPFDAKKYQRNDDKFDIFVEDLLHKVEDEDSGGFNRNNIIAHYLRELKDKREKGLPTLLSEVGIGRVICDLMTAGTETTSSTIRWFYIFMIHHPHVQKKVQDELDEKIGCGRNPKITDRPKLVYLNATIMETQRFASIIPFGLFHRCNEDTRIGGYTIPKDTHVMTHLDAVLHSEDIWGDPQNFRPERFIGEQGNLLSPEELAPFSLGRRLCLGEALAKAELFLFLSHILQRYQLAPERPGSPPTFDSIMGISLAPAPHNIMLVRREGHNIDSIDKQILRPDE
ncbi:cytochrome P450 2U1, partial [Elysia marginata]